MPVTQPYYQQDFTKPDGRALTLYGLRPIQLSSEVPSPGAGVQALPELRWHPLRQEWVMYAAHRAARTFLPPPEYNPLAPTHDPQHPTELPRGTYDMAVFDNRFPSLSLSAPPVAALAGVERRAGVGQCEVVVFSQDASGTLGGLPAARVELLLHVWAERTQRCRAAGLASMLAFENRGVEVGVTLHHPHGQLYAYDHIPPVQQQLLSAAQAYAKRHGQLWLSDFVASERAAAQRLVRDEGAALSVVPPFARYSYETWVLPARPAAYLSDLTPQERRALAVALKDALLRLDALFEVRMPYLLTVHQAPLQGQHPEFPLHIELYPYLRGPGKLKYLAGTEQGAGEFANDILPEYAAAQLRACQP